MIADDLDTEMQKPLIYFLGVAPASYQAILPVFIAGWDALALKAKVAFGAPLHEATGFAESTPDRQYAMRLVKQRLHQVSFREAVISAYGSRCAISGLPEPLLLDAAHIVADRDELLGQPVVANGIPYPRFITQLLTRTSLVSIQTIDCTYPIGSLRRRTGRCSKRSNVSKVK